MPAQLFLLALYALLSIGAVVAVVLTVKALRRIAHNHERSVALLEELVQQRREDPPNADTQEADPAGPPAT